MMAKAALGGKLMGNRQRRLELNCLICSQPLTSTQSRLNEDVLQMVAEQNVLMKHRTDHMEYTNYRDISEEQVVATKCGHMYHMGCLKHHVKSKLERGSTAPCPICSKPVTLTKVWPILIPPTPSQLYRLKKMHQMKTQNTQIKIELRDIRERIRGFETALVDIEKETNDCLADIQIKQKYLDELNGPTEEELEELRKIHKKRQSIVRVVTKHNADLLGVLMHETKVQMSETDFVASDLDMDLNHNNVNWKSEKSSSRSRRKSRSKSKSKKKLQSRSQSRKREESLSRDLSDDLSEILSDVDSENSIDPFEELKNQSSASFSLIPSRIATPPGRNAVRTANKKKGTLSSWLSRSKQKFLNCDPQEIKTLMPTVRKVKTLNMEKEMVINVGATLTRKDGTRGLVKKNSSKNKISPKLKITGRGRSRSRPPAVVSGSRRQERDLSIDNKSVAGTRTSLWANGNIARRKQPTSPSKYSNINNNNNNNVNRVRLRPKWC